MEQTKQREAFEASHRAISQIKLQAHEQFPESDEGKAGLMFLEMVFNSDNFETVKLIIGLDKCKEIADCKSTEEVFDKIATSGIFTYRWGEAFPEIRGLVDAWNNSVIEDELDVEEFLIRCIATRSINEDRISLCERYGIDPLVFAGEA